MKIKKFISKHKYSLAIVFLLVAFSLFMSLLFTKESDYFWHIKAGEYMLKNWTILKRDIFSWSMSGKYWMSHEWLFECFIYLLKCVFGKGHLFVYSFGSILLLLLVLFFTNKKACLKNIIFTLCFIVSFLLFCVYIQARPHLLSFTFVALTIYLLLDLFYNANSKKVYFLPVIALLWANFHGGSSNLSYLFPLIFMVVGLFNFSFSKVEAKRISKKQIEKYLLVTVLSIVAICFNPHGVKMLSYPYLNMADSVMLNLIVEWQPTVLGNINHLPYFILIVCIMAIMLFSDKKIRFIDLALLGISLVLGLKSIRFWGYTYILMSYVIFYYIPSRKADRGTCLVITALGCLFLIMFTTNFSQLVKEYDKTNISNMMVSVIKNASPKRLYNMYDYGGELIYNDILVFVDGRADLYSKYNLRDYEAISKLEDDYVKLINKYDFDYFLVMEKYPISKFLKYSDEYELVYAEKDMLLYKKRNSTV